MNAALKLLSILAIYQFCLAQSVDQHLAPSCFEYDYKRLMEQETSRPDLMFLPSYPIFENFIKERNLKLFTKLHCPSSYDNESGKSCLYNALTRQKRYDIIKLFITKNALEDKNRITLAQMWDGVIGWNLYILKKADLGSLYDADQVSSYMDLLRTLAHHSSSAVRPEIEKRYNKLKQKTSQCIIIVDCVNE